VARPAPHDEHLELLHRARRVQRAAAAGEVDRVHSELCELRNLLVPHLRAEMQHRRPASDLRARLTSHGQERLLRFVERLLADADDELGACSCLVRVAELRAMLIRQIRLEGGAVSQAS
jgi:hypothetical protein